jgi:hypothetical protein
MPENLIHLNEITNMARLGGDHVEKFRATGTRGWAFGVRVIRERAKDLVISKRIV